MVGKNKKRNWEKIFFNQKFLSLVGLALLLLISYPLVKNSLKQYRLNKEIDDYKKEISALENRNGDLKNFITYLESDQFAEEQARLNLNLKKPGEELTVIKNASSAPALSEQIFNIPGYNHTTAPASESNPRRWFNYFFN